MRRHGSPEELERVRRQAVAMADRGFSTADIAKALDRAPRSVQKWLKAARDGGGVEAVAAVPHPGAPFKLSAKQRKGLVVQLLKGAQAHGWSTDLWTAPRVGELILWKYGVEYHPHHIPQLLRSLGWSLQKPELRSRQRDEADIAQWVAKEWPRIKKRSPG